MTAADRTVATGQPTGPSAAVRRAGLLGVAGGTALLAVGLFALGVILFALTYIRFLFDHHNEFIGWSMLVAVGMMAAGWWLMS